MTSCNAKCLSLLMGLQGDSQEGEGLKGGGGEFPVKVSATSSGQSRVVCLCFALRTDFAQLLQQKRQKGEAAARCGRGK